MVSIRKWSAAGKVRREEHWFNGQKWSFFYKDSRWSLVKRVTVNCLWWMTVMQLWHIRDDYVMNREQNTIIFRQIFYWDENCFVKKSVYSDKNCFTSRNKLRSILASSCKRFLHLLSNSLPPSQKRGFLHKTRFLYYKFSTSHFINGWVFFRVPTLKWHFLSELIDSKK